jgi:hypothetical protein
VTGRNRSNSALGRSARLRASIALGVTAAAVVLATIAVDSAGAQPEAPPGTHVGKLDGTSAFVAVLVGDTERIRAYALNSSQRLVAWTADGLSEARSREERIGTPYGSRLRSSNRYGLRATVAAGLVTGSIRFPSGERHRFEAGGVAGPHSQHQIVIGRGTGRLFGRLGRLGRCAAARLSRPSSGGEGSAARLSAR